MRELGEFWGLGCHSDTCLCCNSRGLGQVRRAGGDLVP